MELGLITLTELTPDATTGAVVSPRQRIAEIIDAAQLAEQAGLDHRRDYAASAPQPGAPTRPRSRPGEPLFVE